MNKQDRTLAIFAVFGVGAALAYWFYLRWSDPDNAPSLSDIWGTLQSYGVRGYLSMRGKVQKVLDSVGAGADARSIALGFIAEQEEFSAKAYPDPPGQTNNYSIGYGHQIVPGDGFTKDSTISQSDALGLLDSDLDSRITFVDSHVTVSLNPYQKAALYSFCYNEGTGAFASSTLLKKVNAGDFAGASEEFPRWIYAENQVLQSLVNRRSDEQALFNT